MTTRTLCLATIAGVLFAGGTHVRADFESIDAWAEASAKDIVSEADSRNATTIFVDAIKGEPELEGSSGSRLSIALEKALRSTKLSLSRQNYQFKVQGLFRKRESPETKKIGTEVVLKFVDRNDDTLGKKTRFIFGETATHALLNTNVHIPPGTNDKQRDEILRNPKAEVKIQGTKIRTTAASPYAVEVLVKKDGKYAPRAAAEAKETNRPFVEIHRNEVYALRLHNDSDIEAAVHVTVDGLSVFEFSTIKERPFYWIVPKKSHLDVLGWKITEEKTDEFKSVDFPAGAAAEKKLSHDERIGVINALFFASWEDEKNPPPGESGSKATGRGDRIDDKVKVVTRYIGKLRDSISVRYERELPKE